MKYGEGLDLSNTIRNYEKDNNLIKINYLDGNSKKVLLTDSNEQELLETMITQAREYTSMSGMEKSNLILSFCSSINSMIPIVGVLSGEIPKDCYTMVGAFSIFNGLMALYFGLEIPEKIKIELEKKKYREYIELIDKNEENILDHVNINTLDNYSLKDIKKIKKKQYIRKLTTR